MPTRLKDGGIDTVVLTTSGATSEVTNNIAGNKVRVAVIGAPVHIRFASDSTVADANDAIMPVNSVEVFEIKSTSTCSILRATGTDAIVSITIEQ